MSQKGRRLRARMEARPQIFRRPRMEAVCVMWLALCWRQRLRRRRRRIPRVFLKWSILLIDRHGNYWEGWTRYSGGLCKSERTKQR